MSLTWKDGVTTLLAGVVLVIYYAKVTTGIRLPFISESYRWAVTALAIVGIAMCALSSASTAGKDNPFVMAAGILGVVSFVLIIWGLISGTKVAFLFLVADLLILWTLATTRHLIGK